MPPLPLPMRISPIAFLPTFVCCLVTLLPAQAPPGMTSELEPNDTVAEANAIGPGQQVQASLMAGDVDFYSFALGAPTRVHLFTGRVGGVATDTVLRLWDATGATLLAYDDDSRDSLSSLSVDLPLGTWYVSVSGFSATTSGAYALDYGTDAVQVYALTEDSVSEQNNNRNSNNGGIPTPIPSGPCLVTVDAQRPNATDEDWYSLSLPTQSGVWILVNEGKGSWISQYRWDLLDGNGAALPTSHGTTGGNSARFNVRSSLQRVWSAGNYRIKISERTGCTLGGVSVPCRTLSPYSLVPDGAYSLSVLTVPMLTGVTRVHTGTPPTLAGGDVGSGSLSGPPTNVPLPSQDWLIHTDGPSTLFLQTRGGSGTPLQDTIIQLFDASGKLVASSGGGNVLADSRHARMVVSISEAGGGDYTARVTGGSTQPQSYPASYLLEVGLASCTPYLSAAVNKTDGNEFCTTGGLRVEYGTQPGELPVVGTLFVLDVANAPPLTLLLRMIGFSNTFSGTFGPLPFHMAPLGAPSCSLFVDPLVVQAWFASPSGTAQLSQSIPASPTFLGMTLHEQVGAFDAAANPLGLVLSNALSYVIGNRPF